MATEFPKLRQDLEYSQTEVDGQLVYNIKDPVTKSYFRVREPEYWLIQQLDGKTDFETVAERFRDKYNMNLGAEQVGQFAEALEKLYFLEGSRAEQATSRSSYIGGDGDSLFSRLLLIKIKAFNPERFLNWLVRLYRPFHTRFWFVLSALFILLGVAVLFANIETFSVNLFEVFNLGSVVTIVLGLFIIVSLHEFAHAVVCRYYGGQVQEIGFLLLFFQPCFYSDLSDAWLFPRKSQRLAVTFAGPYMQLLLLAAAVLLWRVTVPGEPFNELVRIIAIVCWVTILFNFLPLIKLDGYYLLSDLVDIANLRSKSFEYLGNLFKRRVLGWPIEPIEIPRRQRRILTWYAIIAGLYTIFLLGYLLTLAGRFLLAKAGVLGLLALVAALLVTLRTYLVRVAKGTVQHIKYMKSLLQKPVRLTVYVLIIVVVLILVLAVPFDHRVSGEVIVRPEARFSVLFNDFGLLESKLETGGSEPRNASTYLQMTSTDMARLEVLPVVRDGQTVTEGDTLAVVLSNQVSSEIRAAQSELRRLEQQLALLKSPPKREAVDRAQAEVNAAMARHDRLKREWERVQQMHAKELATQEELESAEAAYEVAIAELENRRSELDLLKAPPKPEEEAVLLAGIETQQAQLDFLTSQLDAQVILSPIAGVVSIQSGDGELLHVMNRNKVELKVPISDFDINLVEAGQPVKVKVRSFADRTFDGEVVHVPQGASGSATSSEFTVTVSVDNTEGVLLEGMTGYAKIHVGEASLARLLLRKLTSNLRVEFWSLW